MSHLNSKKVELIRELAELVIDYYDLTYLPKDDLVELVVRDIKKCDFKSKKAVINKVLKVFSCIELTDNLGLSYYISLKYKYLPKQLKRKLKTKFV